MHRVALVTGAGRGVGQGIARVLAGHGVAVAVNDLHPERAEATAGGIAATGGRAMALPFDVTDRSAIEAGVATVAAHLGPVDVLVNNAGIAEHFAMTRFLETDPTDWGRDLELNLFGSMHCIQVVVPAMVARGFGRVVQISSGAAAAGLASGLSTYGAAKAATESLVRHLAVELGPTGVTVNAISLGLMDDGAGTPPTDPARRERQLRAIPAGRLGQPEEVGAAVAWLASEEAALVTGQVVHVNGGALHGR